MPLTLEDFQSVSEISGGPDAGPGARDGAALEAQNMASYEQGYKAGWDDAARTEAEDQERIGADFARSLQELSFTFHEARAHVIQSIEPLLTELVETLLPPLIVETMGARILAEIEPLIEDAADAPIELVVSPGSRTALEGQLQKTGAVAIRISEEPSLADGQAYLRIGQAERQIDLTGALERILQAIRSLRELNERTLKYG